MNKKIKEFGAYPTIKGHATLAVVMYRGWEIRRIAGGPEARVDLPTFKGVMKNSRRLPGHDIETPTMPSIAGVKRAIDKFQDSDYAEGPKVYGGIG